MSKNPGERSLTVATMSSHEYGPDVAYCKLSDAAIEKLFNISASESAMDTSHINVGMYTFICILEKGKKCLITLIKVKRK